MALTDVKLRHLEACAKKKRHKLFWRSVLTVGVVALTSVTLHPALAPVAWATLNIIWIWET